MGATSDDGIRHEVGFWRDFLLTKGTYWGDPDIAADFRSRVDPDEPLAEPMILERLEEFRSSRISILDVGAGPLTVLGKRYPGKTLEIVPVDPLADEYDELLAVARIEPPIRTQRCMGEDLLERFEPATFDLAYARNALDHSADPLRIVRNMVAVVKPGGFVLLRHLPNEAEYAGYDGLHRWNFDVRDGRPVLWSRTDEYDLTEEVGGDAEVECAWREGWVEWALRRRP